MERLRPQRGGPSVGTPEVRTQLQRVQYWAPLILLLDGGAELQTPGWPTELAAGLLVLCF